MTASTLFSGCSQKVCEKQVYPQLKTINTVPRVNIEVKHGRITQNGTNKVFNTIKGLRVSERFYSRQIRDYREFVKSK